MLLIPCTKGLILLLPLTLLVATWIPSAGKAFFTRYPFFLLFPFILAFISADSYDPLDPNGNITIIFDIHHWTDDGYLARVTIQNYYQYRHVEKPGWSLGWNWTNGEIIWSMSGAVATQQGNCSNFTSRIPHSCKPDPTIVDLTPEAGAENRTDGCCHGGLLAGAAIDPANSFTSFDVMVGNLGNKRAYIPTNLTLMAPDVGYTCGKLEDVAPTVVTVEGGKREEQVFRTWKSACTYSSFVANKPPACCVSLSTFYNPKVTPCPTCACGACPPANQTGAPCIGDGGLKLPSDRMCTEHMCPVRVHWHVKSNYMDQWRVKVTVSNYNYGYNYSDWNLVVQHPGFNQPTQTYSFNSTSLLTVGGMDEAAIFWGLEYYNDELLQAGNEMPGSVTTDILVGKDRDSFTLSNGWALPRRVYFNGENCEMPMPDSFPGLPSSGFITSDARYRLLLLLPLVLLL